MTTDAVTVGQVLEFLGERVIRTRGVQEPTAIVRGASPVDPGEPQTISFWRPLKSGAPVTPPESASSLVLVPEPYVDSWPLGNTCLVAVADPRTEYLRVLNRFFAPERPSGIHPTAFVSASARIGTDVYIGAGAYIGDACVGDRTVIGPNAAVLDQVTIGSDCVIGPNTTIGHTGFGYGRDIDGTPVPFPHTGGVVIGDRVEIGANTAVDRGALSDTLIEDDAKIDNLVHIAHNVKVGKGAFVIATAIICGSVEIGPRAWIAPNASVREKLHIGADAQVGLAATVVKDVRDGAIVFGSPARERS